MHYYLVHNSVDTVPSLIHGYKSVQQHEVGPSSSENDVGNQVVRGNIYGLINGFYCGVLASEVPPQAPESP